VLNNNIPVWISNNINNNKGTPPYRFTMQPDGNLVLQDKYNIWDME
jgi:hypothetical protein